MYTNPYYGSDSLGKGYSSLHKQQETMRQLFAEDCLKTLSDELAISPSSIDLIYLDPPFNSKST